MLGFSAKTIRRDIASMPDDVRKMSLACPSDVPVMSLTEYGLKWLAEKHGVPFSGSSPDGSSGDLNSSIDYCMKNVQQWFLSPPSILGSSCARRAPSASRRRRPPRARAPLRPRRRRSRAAW